MVAAVGAAWVSLTLDAVLAPLVPALPQVLRAGGAAPVPAVVAAGVVAGPEIAEQRVAGWPALRHWWQQWAKQHLPLQVPALNLQQMGVPLAV